MKKYCVVLCYEYGCIVKVFMAKDRKDIMQKVSKSLEFDEEYIKELIKQKDLVIKDISEDKYFQVYKSLWG